MKKKLIKPIIIIILIFGLYVLANTILNAFLSGPRLKAMLIEPAEKALARDVEIGSIDVSIFRGISINKIEVRDVNPEEILASIDSFNLSYDFISLFKRKLLIRSVVISNPKINLFKNNDGIFNVATLGTPVANKVEEPNYDDEPADPIPLDLSFDNITISGAVLTLTDKTGKLPAVVAESNASLSLKLGKNGLADSMINGSINVLANAEYEGKKPVLILDGKFTQKTVSFHGNLSVEFDRFVIKGKVDNYLNSPEVKLDVSSPKINLDNLITLFDAGKSPVRTSQGKPEENQTKEARAGTETLPQTDVSPENPQTEIKPIEQPLEAVQSPEETGSAAHAGQTDQAPMKVDIPAKPERAASSPAQTESAEKSVQTAQSPDEAEPAREEQEPPVVKVHEELIDKAEQTDQPLEQVDIADKAETTIETAAEIKLPEDSPAKPEEAVTTDAEKAEMTQPEARGMDVSYHGEILINNLISKNYEMSNIKLNYSLKDNIFQANNIKLEVFDGGVTGNITLDLNSQNSPMSGEVRTDKLQVSDLLKSLGKPSESLSGALSSNLSFSGTGLTWTILQKTLSGTGDYNLIDGGINSPVTSELAILLGIPELGNLRYKNLSGSMNIDKGQVLLNASLSGKQLEMTGTGYIGLDGVLNMPLRIRLSPDYSQRLTDKASFSQYLADEQGQISMGLILNGNASEPKITIDQSQVVEQVKEAVVEKAGEELKKVINKELGENSEEGNIVKGLSEKFLNEMFKN